LEDKHTQQTQHTGASRASLHSDDALDVDGGAEKVRRRCREGAEKVQRRCIYIGRRGRRGVARVAAQ
jgi:hypothetical protein